MQGFDCILNFCCRFLQDAGKIREAANLFKIKLTPHSSDQFDVIIPPISVCCKPQIQISLITDLYISQSKTLTYFIISQFNAVIM